MSFVCVEDARLNTEDLTKSKYVVVDGPRTSYTQIPPSSLSTGTIVYQLNSIGPNVGRNRLLWVNLVGTYVINGTNLIDPAPGVIGFKTAPMNRCIQSVQHTINSCTETYNLNQIIDFITRIKADPTKLNFLDNFTSDISVDYASVQNTNMSPIAPFTSVANGDTVKPRNSGITNIVVSNGGTVLTISFNIWEPLITPFSAVSERNLPCLWGIDGETIQVQWANNLTDLICYSEAGLYNSGGSVSSYALSSLTAATMHIEYVTRPNMMLPNESIYQFPKYQVFQNPALTATAGQTQTVTVQVNSQTIPSKLYVFVRPTETQRLPNLADFYLTISAIQVQLDNGTTLLNGACQRRLFDISRHNGLKNTNYQMFSSGPLNGSTPGLSQAYGYGSLLCLDPARDLSIGAEEGLTNCSSGKYTMQLIITFTNNTPYDFVPGQPVSSVSAFVYTQNDAELIRSGRTYVSQLLAYTQEDVKMAKANPANYIDQEEYENARAENLFLSGGSFKSFFKKVFNVAKKGANFIKDHKDEIQKVAKLGQSAYKAYKGSGVEMYY